MPRPGTVPPVKAGPNAEHGANAELARTQLPRSQSDAALGGGPVPGQQQVDPSMLGLPPEADPTADINEGYDEAIFAPTMRQAEPITTGVAFGAGANYRQSDREDDRTFILRVADDLERTGSSATRKYIEKIRLGG